MKKNSILVLLCGIVLGSFCTTIVMKTVFEDNSIVESDTLVYSNTDLAFSLAYPKELTEIDVLDNVVSFTRGQDMYRFAIRVSATDFETAEAWFDDKMTNKNESSAITKLAKVGSQYQDQDAYLVITTLPVDHDNGTPIYGQQVGGVLVKNGKLYELLYNNQFPVEDTVTLDLELAQVLASLKAL